MEEIYLVCEDSMEGIFTAIYDAFACGKEREHLHIQVGEEENLRLFAVYKQVLPDHVKTAKVAKTISREFGMDAFKDICQALSSPETDKGEAIYRALVGAFRMSNKRNALTNLADPYIHRVFALSRSAGCEIHHLKGFLRFKELENGILFSEIGPKNNILTFLADHFADRFPRQNFVISDANRGIFVIHPDSKPWYVMRDLEIQGDWENYYSKNEKEYQQLFTWFCHKIAIEGRKNLKLQRNMLPLRFQEYMVEFDKKL